MKKTVTILLVAVLAATGCGGGGSSWQDEMAKAVEQLEAEGVGANTGLPISGTSPDELEASIDDLCSEFDAGTIPSDQLASVPAILMIGLRQAGASTDTLKMFGKSIDRGMEEECPAAHEDLFAAGPLTSWEQAGSCDGDITALVTDPAGALASMCPN